MFIFRRNQAIRQKIDEYLVVVSETLDIYQEGMTYYIEHGLDDHFETLLEKTHKGESQADDLRREIEGEMYEKSLLPDVREDIMRIIEQMDKIPNKCDHILRRIWTHDIQLPEELHGRVIELVQVGVDCCKPLREAVLDVLQKCEQIKEIARKIDGDESVGDHLEHELNYQIFHSDYEPFDKLLYRDVVHWIGSLPDRAEQICDQLTIFSIKRDV